MYELLPEIDPAENLPYSADFSNFIDPDDSISTQTVTISPTGPTLSTPVVVGDVVTTFVSGCVLNTSYVISFEIVTARTWTVKRSGIINCMSR